MFQKQLVPPNLIIIHHFILTSYPCGLAFLPGEVRPSGYIPFGQGQCWGLNAIEQHADTKGPWWWLSQLLLLSEEEGGTKMKPIHEICLHVSGHSSAPVSHFGWKFKIYSTVLCLTSMSFVTVFKLEKSLEKYHCNVTDVWESWLAFRVFKVIN